MNIVTFPKGPMAIHINDIKLVLNVGGTSKFTHFVAPSVDLIFRLSSLNLLTIVSFYSKVAPYSQKI